MTARRLAGLMLPLVALLALVPEAASAWGATGHRVVGRIAERHVSPATARALREILGPDSLAEISTWADEIRSDPDLGPESSTWHYVTIEDGETYETSKKAEHDILERIGHFEAVLADRTAPAADRHVAIAWLVHLVGDLHQPLHVGRGDDRGGNEIVVLWHGEPSNLHRIWDSAMIEHTGLSFSEMAEFLDEATPEQIELWQSTDHHEWARESFALRSRVYAIGNRKLSWSYSYEQKELVDERLLQAGIRLAGLLDEALAPAPATP